MKYPVRCTCCISLLKNTKRYKNAYYYMNNGEMYIDVETREESDIIAQLNFYQEGTFRTYKQMLNINNEEDELC